MKKNKKNGLLKKILACLIAIAIVVGVGFAAVYIIEWNDKRAAMDSPEKQYAYYLDNKESFNDAVDAFIENGSLQVITTQKTDMIENAEYFYSEPIPGMFVQSSEEITKNWNDSIISTPLSKLLLEERVVTARWEIDYINNYQCIAFYADKNGETSSGWLYVMNGFKPEFENKNVTLLEPIDDEWYVFKTEPKQEEE